MGPRRVRTLVALVLVLGVVHPVHAGDDATALTALGRAAKCRDKASPLRPWCIATRWRHGKPTRPTRTLIGLTVALEDGKDYADALSNKVTLVALAVQRRKAKLFEIKPTEPGEEAMLGEAVAAIASVFKGKAKRAALPENLATYIRGRKATYPMARGRHDVYWRDPNRPRLRKVGAFWVAIEHPSENNGVWITILTDAWR